jgi:hypothetical protein
MRARERRGGGRRQLQSSEGTLGHPGVLSLPLDQRVHSPQAAEKNSLGCESPRSTLANLFRCSKDDLGVLDRMRGQPLGLLSRWGPQGWAGSFFR